MKNLNALQPPSGESSASRFEAARVAAFTLALADPELIAWKDRTTLMASPELEGCSGPYGWRDYGISHDGRLEVDVGGEAIFIFAESQSLRFLRALWARTLSPPSRCTGQRDDLPHGRRCLHAPG